MIRKSTIFLGLLAAGGYSLLADLAYAIEVPAGFGTAAGSQGSDFAGYIRNLYLYGLGTVGILAVGVIVFGAIYYAVSGGSPDKQRDAKSYIMSAIWGLALLLGSYLILNTINPQITALGTIQNYKTCGDNQNPQTDGCIPRTPKDLLPACTGRPLVVVRNGSTSTVPEEPGGNCLPACENSQRPCNVGESPSTGSGGCTACAYVPPSCSKSTIDNCKPVIYTSDRIHPPKCGAPDYCNNNITPDEGGIKLNDGVIYQYPYYPSKKGVEAAQCIIQYYRESVDGELRKPGLTGLKPC